MTHRLLVLGAGYSGLAAARRAHDLARRERADVTVTLVNATPDFVERVRLHQVAAGQDVGVHSLAHALDGTGIDLVVGLVEGVDPDARAVTVRAGQGPRTLGYDSLILALGSSAGAGRVPGADEHALTIADLDGARAVAARIAADRPERLVVVGGGLTGIEAASEIAESHPGIGVALVTGGEVAPGAGVRGRAHVRRVLHRLGVTVREHARVEEVDAQGLLMADGERVPADLVVWNAGFSASGLPAAIGLAVDDDGRAMVDASQRSLSHPDVLVVGDAAHTLGSSGAPLRMSCAMGLPMGWNAAEAVLARLAGRTPAAAPFGYLVQCVSLGRRDGLIQFVRADDSPRPFHLAGGLAARVKEYIVAGAYDNARTGGQAAVYLRVSRAVARRHLRREGARPGAVQRRAPSAGAAQRREPSTGASKGASLGAARKGRMTRSASGVDDKRSA
ncbi:NADH dehydrogenase FAD-containing subunit [Nocardiopsis sp. Huas11]|uniref:NAD(P)/FAD-dependent oxidoreductase n=1 Tax=Nocardiopsis sp. Huas11 TaxID=2183912 RepID=UPI000EB43BDD|nr:FAD-dependent oxidoreductase [Nocardiopsis sp. Huas11]RKS08979.1 NADH dehydrogenase FAD-containing subunit [Nocardiopsis sp. Huas11]